VRGGFHRFTLGLLIAAAICLAGGLLTVVQAQAGGPDAQPAAQAARAPQSGAAYAAGEVLVRLRAGVSLSNKKALASSLGSAKFRDLGVRAILPRGERILLYKSTALTGDALVKSALQNADVIAASLNYRRYASAAQVFPNDPDFLDLWGLDNIGQTAGTVGADISAPEAWGITTGSSGVVVADIDSGVAYDHPDLAANMWRNPFEIPANGIDDDLNGYVDDAYGIDAVNGDGDPYDDDAHGTHTAGTMAAVGNNGIGITGVAWQARIMALKYLDSAGSGHDADAITSINYAIDEKLNHGVNVVAINASWGGAGYNPLLRDAIDAAGAAGIIFCAAAGNGGTDRIGDDNDATPQYPSSYDCPNIIAVASTNSTDALASSANYGATSVDLAAPGVGILSTVPSGRYASMSGTSMATAHVTGAVALCAAQYPSETMAQRVQRILDHVDPLTSLSGKMATGGRLDLAAAVTPDIPVPAVTSFSPISGPAGIAVTLAGTGFTGATKVAFNGAATATFTVLSDTALTATVPIAATSGTIAVTTQGGTATSTASFTIVVTPTVTLKFSGLKSGAMKLGRSVTATGNVTPTSLAGSKVTLTVQLKEGAVWVKVKTASATISLTGTYRWRYEPANKGAYRMQAAIAKTEPYTAATTKWLTFMVK
jgi:subtilisin family serine protease